MAEYIEKEQIDFGSCKQYVLINGTPYVDLNEIARKIKSIPVADVVPVKHTSITRDQVEKMWRGEWIGSADGYADGELVYDIWECSECGYVIDEEDDPDMLPQFCPKCYAPMTDEAVDIVMERLEALKDETD